MKTLKTIFRLLLLLVIIAAAGSCTKYERQAELSLDAQQLEFDNTVKSRKFNVMNKGDELLFVEAYADKNWITVINSSVSLPYGQSFVFDIRVNTDLIQGYGIFTGNLFLNSNGGNFIIPVTLYLLQSSGPQLALDLDYLKFPVNVSQDYFTIYNDGNQNLNFQLSKNKSWVQFSQSSGLVLPNGEKKIYIDVNRSGLGAGFYSAEINITTNGGNAVLDLDMDVLVYSVTFFNPVYTPIKIKANGFNIQEIEAGERHSFIFPNNPSSFAYTANTMGKTNDGKQLGIEIKWEEVINVSGLQSPTYNLNVNADYFFMAVKNSGNYHLNLWSINYGNSFQIDDDFYIPNDGIEYGVAYYDAFDDTEIYARLAGTNNDVKWSNGFEFNFPWTANQYILLQNSFKKTQSIRPNTKSASGVESYVSPMIKPKQKDKGSIDLYNK